MQTHSHQTHSHTTPESDRRTGSEGFPQLGSSQQSQASESQAFESQSDQSQAGESRERTSINVPARALLAALKVHYQISSQSLTRFGIPAQTLEQDRYIRSILSQPMSSIFSILSTCQDCAEHVGKVLIDDIDIEDISHELILEAVRRRAVELLVYAKD